jgi:triosephosphate isomerase
MIFINFKAYRQGSGRSALELLEALEQASKNTGVKVISALQASDIKEAVLSTKLEIWAQHIDPFEYGAHTGAILAEAVFEDGACGTFLNHSERKYPDFDSLEKACRRAQDVGLKTLIFASDLEELKVIIRFKPTYVSYEPPELIGSDSVSVVQAKADIVSDAVDIARSVGVPLIVGAGIKSGEDVRKSLDLGASGVVVASAVVDSSDPRREIMDLLEGFR